MKIFDKIRGKSAKDKSREAFLYDIRAFIDDGLVEELYHNKKISILKCCGTFYVATDYSQAGLSYFAILFDRRTLDYMTINENNYYKVVKDVIGTEWLKEHYIVFDSDMHDRMQRTVNMKGKGDPPEGVDKEFEMRLRRLSSGREFR